MSQHPPAVPEWLQGCWRRAWIRFADGTHNDSDHVYWLQTTHAMADVRVPGRRPSFHGITSFEQCSPDRLAALAANNASTGFTTVDDVRLEADGTRHCVAQWFTYGHGVNFRPECEYPEPGELAVSVDGAVMIERAPSGAYVEEWHLVPGSRASLRHERLGAGRERFAAGPVVIDVRDRSRPMQPGEAFTPEALDCEFSVAVLQPDGRHRIVTSTLPWREGATLDVVA